MDFDIQDSIAANPLGQILRLPCKFVHGKTDAPKAVVQAIAQQLEKTQKNILPIIAREIGEDHYEAILNTQILEAAIQKKLDFVWCILVDEAMAAQIQIESWPTAATATATATATESSQSLINLRTASIAEIEAMFKWIKANQSGFNKIDPAAIAQSIVDYRQKKKITSLNFIATLKCGIGKAKLPTLVNSFSFG
jgi:DNA uptake protein ComE-like DNA-binding protein